MTSSSYYKQQKLDFVSNLNGTTFNEVFNLISIFPLIHFLCILIKSFWLTSFVFPSLISSKSSLYWKSFSIDYAFSIVPLILVLTLLSDWTSHVRIGLMASIFVLYFIMNKSSAQSQPAVIIQKETMSQIEKKILKLSISTIRLWLYLLTCVSILAVDFNVFPRRFAKTETYGVSVMDLGVGFYMVCHAIKVIRNDQSQSVSFNVTGELMREMKSCSILLMFGLGRIFSLKSTDYVEHVSEYGVHWNFLFTIVAVRILAVPFKFIARGSWTKGFFLSVCVGMYYQYCLIERKFSAYLLSDERNLNSFLDSNKEGIFSCMGYLSIYLAAWSMCLCLNSIVNKETEESTNERPFTSSFRCIIVLISFAFIFFTAFNFTRNRVQNVSRRLCNLSFICYTLLCSTLLLLFYMSTVLLMARIYQKKSKPEHIVPFLSSTFWFIEIIDSKFIGLAVFMVCNLLTGLVNLSINTLLVTDLHAFLILCAYGLVSFGLPYFFYFVYKFKPHKD